MYSRCQLVSGAMWNSKHSMAYITPRNATIPNGTFLLPPFTSLSFLQHGCGVDWLWLCRTRKRVCKPMPIYHCKMSIEPCIIPRFQFHIVVESLIDVRHTFSHVSVNTDILVHFIGIDFAVASDGKSGRLFRP